MLIAVSIVLATWSPSAAAPDDGLPPDDGAPASDYIPHPDARLLAPPSADGAVLTAVGDGTLESPPVDNAFPIFGRNRSVCNDSFGDPRSGGRPHMGVDCFAPLGTPLVAVEAGTIRYATEAGPFSCTSGGDISGNRVSVRGRSGYVYYYGHLNTINVATDQPVEKGDVIGTVGRTGNAACSSPHLHLEVKCGENGEPFDPYPVIESWGRVTFPATRWPSTNLQGAGVSLSGTAREDLFVLECGEAIRQRTWYAGQGLSPGWYPVNGIAASDPDAASAGPGAAPSVFVRGTDSVAYQIIWTGSAWYVSNLGGICTSGPAAAYSGPSHAEVFCRGSDQALYQRVWDASSGWTASWARVGGIVTSDPDVTSPGPQYPSEVVVRGNDNAIYHLYQSTTGWVTTNLGGTCSSGPSAAYSGPDRLDVFCRGDDLALYHRFWLESTGWSPSWQRIESRILSDPEAVSAGPGHVAQVFVRGLDRRVYQFQWTGGSWSPWVWGLT